MRKAYARAVAAAIRATTIGQFRAATVRERDGLQLSVFPDNRYNARGGELTQTRTQLAR